MNKKAQSVFVSMLFGSALVLPATAGAAPANAAQRHFAHFRWSPAARLAERVMERGAVRAHKPAMRSANGRAILQGVQYDIIDEPDADPGLYGTRVFAINESGAISGQFMDSEGRFHAFLRTPDNTFTPITVKRNDTFVGGLNDKGESFGSYIDNASGLEIAWLRGAKGKIKTIQPPDAANGSWGAFLNNKGKLGGNYIDGDGAIHTFLLESDGAPTELDDAPGAGGGLDQGSQGISINAAGEISGQVTDSNNVMHAFIRSVGGTYTVFDVPGAGSGEFQGTVGVEIDNKGWLAGVYIDSNDVTHGFIRDPAGHLTSPIDAPDAGSGPGQGTMVEHREAGWAVGEYIDSNDVWHGYYRKDKNGKLVEFDPPGAGDIGTFQVWSSNRDHRIAGTFKDENGIRHGFIRNP